MSNSCQNSWNSEIVHFIALRQDGIRPIVSHSIQYKNAYASNIMQRIMLHVLRCRRRIEAFIQGHWESRVMSQLR